MSQEPSIPVDISILDKEYRVACPPSEREALERSARFLDGKMREIRHTGKVIGNDRVAVMAALNITYELLQLRATHAPATHEVLPASLDVQALGQRIRETLERCKPAETDLT
ncbi:MAG: cell division protein ZapA [Gammaproteobacteria bacterium]|nr:cell division protein ZapA [Gammaproteobacteria bacterium]